MENKGQLSLEFLLLLLIFLAMLSISLFALVKLRGFVSDELHRDSMGRMLAKISYYSEEVCMLGEGNVRTVKERNLGGFGLAKEGENLRITSGGFELSEKIPCSFEVLGQGYQDGEAMLEMRGGMVRLSPG